MRRRSHLHSHLHFRLPEPSIENVTEAEALESIRGLAGANRYVVRQHADNRMRERNITNSDLRAALVAAKSAEWQAEKGTWKTTGPDVDGDDLTVAVALEEDLVVVTVF